MVQLSKERIRAEGQCYEALMALIYKLVLKHVKIQKILVKILEKSVLMRCDTSKHFFLSAGIIWRCQEGSLRWGSQPLEGCQACQKPCPH